MGAIFEIIYILFPLIFVTRKNLDGEHLTFFETSSYFTLQAILALFFLMRKCRYFLYKLDPAQILDSHHRHLYNMKIGKYDEQVPWIVTKKSIEYQHGKNFNFKVKGDLDKITTTSVELSSIPPSRSTNNNVQTPSGDMDISNLDQAVEDTVAMSMISSLSHDSIDEHSRDSNTGNCRNNSNQMFRKTFVCLSGILLFGFGLSILVAFVDFIENGYKSKCIPQKVDINSWDYFNRSDVSEFNKNNPEILIFYYEDDESYQTCRQKAVNLFDYDYPCNCRKFSVTGSYIVSDFEIEILPRIFEKRTMLEAFAVHAWNNDKLRDNVHINFTNNLLNLPH